MFQITSDSEVTRESFSISNSQSADVSVLGKRNALTRRDGREIWSECNDSGRQEG